MSHLAVVKKISSPNSSSDDFFTPLDLWKEWDKEFQFDLDPCGHAQSRVSSLIDDRGGTTLCPPQDGLSVDWGLHRPFVNPPYSRIWPWVEKAHREMIAGCSLVVMLVPANKTEQPWFQDYVEPFRDGRGEHDAFTLETRFIRSRLRHPSPQEPCRQGGDLRKRPLNLETAMTCKDCNAHPSRLCAYHAQTENLSDSIDTELERLREENGRLREAIRRAASTLDSHQYKPPELASEKFHMIEHALSLLRVASASKGRG